MITELTNWAQVLRTISRGIDEGWIDPHFTAIGSIAIDDVEYVQMELTGHLQIEIAAFQRAFQEEVARGAEAARHHDIHQ